MSVASAVQWRKEVRELLPWWAATVIMMVACWALMHPDALPFDNVYSWAILRDRNFLFGVGLCAYVLGAVTLGALSIGHEYSHHTLTQLLAQPIARADVLRVKLVVLAAMLIVLGALALGAWGADPAQAGRPGHLRPLLAVIPLAGGLFIAPWLTMVGRGPLAGAVFTLALFSILWVVGTSFNLPSTYLWLATMTLGGIGAVMTWLTFLRLEAAGGTQEEVDFLAWFSRSTDDTRTTTLGQNRVWLLVKKELRLQQATFVVSGLFVAVWLMTVAGRLLGITTYSAFYVAASLNTGLIPLLAGALASAEERRLGAAEWHALLPLAAWKQWGIKAGVALGMTYALGAVLPTYLAIIVADPRIGDGMEPMSVVMLCVAALYVSSLSTSGLRALLMTGPAIAIALFFGLEVLWGVAEPAQPALRWLARALPIVKISRGAYAYSWWIRHGMEWLAAGIAVPLLAFAYSNHRTADRSRRRAVKQLGWLCGYGLVAMLALQFISQLFNVWLRAAGQ